MDYLRAVRICSIKLEQTQTEIFAWLLEDYLRPNNFPSYTDENSILVNVALNYKITDEFSIGK